MTLNELTTENMRRQPRPTLYDPLTGRACSGARTKTLIPDHGYLYLPDTMLRDYRFNPSMPWHSLEMLRFEHDFEFWAVTCVKIRDKLGAGTIPFVLNAPQRRFLALLEKQRLNDDPLRVIVLKSRQCGGSTLTQVYMAWIQIVLREGRNSAICAHVINSAANIRGMYSKLLRDYPQQYLPDDAPLKFKPYERMNNVSLLTGRDCTVSVSSSYAQESTRGNDISMAHLTEVAFWRSTVKNAPGDLVRAVCAPIPLMPLSLIVIESTANGIGNFFHTEWLRANEGKSDKTPIFIPWHELEIYRLEVDDPMQLWNEMDEYERTLWYDMGLSLEQINWYHRKRLEYHTHRLMLAEYPSTPSEAFNATDLNAFSPNAVEGLRNDTHAPLFRGELEGDAQKGVAALRNLHFCNDMLGKLSVWRVPDYDLKFRNRYVVSMDIGGASEESDFSVISVFDRLNPGAPELVAEWRGHLDLDILPWKAAQIAAWYCNALLIIESNTYDTRGSLGDGGLALASMEGVYRNLYYRRSSDGKTMKLGFHTNRATKLKIIYALIGRVRDKRYTERNPDAITELLLYEHKANGSFGAKDGYHDDLVMTRAIALWVCSEIQPRSTQ